MLRRQKSNTVLLTSREAHRLAAPFEQLPPLAVSPPAIEAGFQSSQQSHDTRHNNVHSLHMGLHRLDQVPGKLSPAPTAWKAARRSLSELAQFLQLPLDLSPLQQLHSFPSSSFIQLYRSVFARFCLYSLKKKNIGSLLS